MKRCSECCIFKEYLEFSKNKNTKDGYSCGCRSCHKTRYTIYYLKNKSEVINRVKLYIENHKEKKRASDKAWYYNNKNKQFPIKRKLSESGRKKHNERNKRYANKNKPALAAKTAKYRCSKLKATPKWLTEFDLDYIKHIYMQSFMLQKLDGINRNVDHIVPLQGVDVCGLHVPWNLQIMNSYDNKVKSNKFKIDI